MNAFDTTALMDFVKADLEASQQRKKEFKRRQRRLRVISYATSFIAGYVAGALED